MDCKDAACCYIAWSGPDFGMFELIGRKGPPISEGRRLGEEKYTCG